jgi:hypothetical protein
LPVLLLGCTAGRTAIDLAPIKREFSFGRVVRRVLGLRIELSPCDVDERAVRESDDLVAVCLHRARCGIFRRDPMSADPRPRRWDAVNMKLPDKRVGRDAALIVRTSLFREAWVAPQEVFDVLVHWTKDEADPGGRDEFASPR